MAESPNNQKMDRDMMKSVNLDSDYNPSGDEDLSYKSESVVTENDVCEEVAGTGIVFLPENSCRAVYKHRSHPKGDPSYICINGELCCHSRVGGYHTKLRINNRAEPGYYRGAYKNEFSKPHS